MVCIPLGYSPVSSKTFLTNFFTSLKNTLVSVSIRLEMAGVEVVFTVADVIQRVVKKIDEIGFPGVGVGCWVERQLCDFV